MNKLATASDLFEAITLAEEAFKKEKLNTKEYCLVKAQRMLTDINHCSGTRCWVLTFKLLRLIPTEMPSKVGAGGELYFTVDLDKGSAIFTGYGE